MAHTIVGEFPKTRRWNRVFDLLGEPVVDPGLVANATVQAAGSRLSQLRGDESLTYCFWILERFA